MVQVDNKIRKANAIQDQSLLVVDRIEKELRKFTQNPGIKIPHERDLAVQYKVSRYSIREAISRLKKDRLIRSIPGKGTITLAPPRKLTTVHLISNSTSVYIMIFIGVIAELLREKGFSTNIICSPHFVEEWQNVAHQTECSLGGILVDSLCQPDIISLTQNSTLPLVQVSETFEPYRSPPVCDTVVNDNRALAYCATDYLIHQGHRRIAFVGWNEPHIWDHDLHSGYTEAFRSHGIDPNPSWLVRLPDKRGPTKPENFDLMETRSLAQIQEWSSSGNPPTAVVSGGDDELWVRECFHKYFNNRFDDNAMMPMMFWEILQTHYRGSSPLTATCGRLRDLAERAIELLQRRQYTQGPPTREFHGRVYLAHRQNGNWKLDE
jgi:DNA-binding transcriptional regulator YhcF (GntR family)